MATTTALSASSAPFSDTRRWVVMYPAYIDAKKTVQQGRRIPKTKAVDTPTIVEIFEVLKAKNLDPLMERNKMYPRDQDREPESQGRIRIQLKNDDGSPKNIEFATRESVFLMVADLIPQLKTRQPGYIPPSASGAAAAGGKKNKKKK